MMPVLERAILRKDWAEEISQRNGIAEQGGQVKVENAGPWEPVVREVIGYQHLGDNWDGFGAEAPSQGVLESAIGLAYCLYEDGVDPPHRVAPGVSGSVIFEWQDSDGTYAEVEIDRPLHADVMVVEPGKPAKQWTLPTE
jgi:hypothetical protein